MAAVYEKIIKYIDEHLKEELTLNEIAKFAGYSTWHLYKIFRVYTAVPVMEYVRKKKIYAAANELYTGRKLYDIALDYGYETPAGFYKAFQNVLGCAPSKYINNNKLKGDICMNIDMKIENVENIEELDECLNFFKRLYPNYGGIENEKYNRNWWIKEFEKCPELLIFAKDNGKICSSLFGWTDGGSVTVNEGVLEEYRSTGIFEALFIELEKRAKKLNCNGVVLGIGEGEEEFYAKLGYTGKMLIQSEKHSVEELKNYLESLNNKNYELTGTNVYEGYINQLWVNISILDKNLKKKFEEELGDCWTQIIVSKGI